MKQKGKHNEGNYKERIILIKKERKILNLNKGKLMFLYFNSSTAGNQDRQNKAFLRTPTNRDVPHRHRTSPSAVSNPMSQPSAKALLLNVSSSSRLHTDLRLAALACNCSASSATSTAV